MKPKRLLVCPSCSTAGKKEVLGELDDMGNLIVQRFRTGSTKVVSKEMLVQCGSCGEIVFYRKIKS